MLIIDGNSLAYRAFHGYPTERYRAPNGVAVNAVYGFIYSINVLVHKYRPNYIAVAFDTPTPTFRHSLQEDYKAGRPATPDDFKGQIDIIKEFLDAMNVSHFAIPTYEADDIAATLATKCSAAGIEAHILSSDKDMLQLVNNNVTVVQPIKGVSELRECTPSYVLSKYGVTPEQYGDFAALVGEKSDNIRGVHGIGPKTAARLITQFGSLEKLIERGHEIPGKNGQELRDSANKVRLNRSINTLLREVPLETKLSLLAVRPWKQEAVEALCLDYGLAHLLARL